MSKNPINSNVLIKKTNKSRFHPVPPNFNSSRKKSIPIFPQNQNLFFICLTIIFMYVYQFPESHISQKTIVWFSRFYNGNKSLKDLSRRYLIVLDIEEGCFWLVLSRFFDPRRLVNLYRCNIKLIKYCFRIYYSFIVSSPSLLLRWLVCAHLHRYWISRLSVQRKPVIEAHTIVEKGIRKLYFYTICV